MGKTIFSAIKGLFSDYRFPFGKKKLEIEDGNGSRILAELAKEIKSENNELSATFKNRLNFETKIKYTSKVTVKAKYRIAFSEHFAKFAEKMVPKRPSKLQRAFIELIDTVQEDASDVYASRVEIRKVSDAVGYGLFTKEDIPKGSVITNYPGEICLHDEAEDNGYLFGFDGTKMNAWVIDPQRKGGYAQFMNHASTRSKKNNIDSEYFFWKGLGHIFFVASRDIPAGSQLLYDYGSDYWKDLGSRPEKF